MCKRTSMLFSLNSLMSLAGGSESISKTLKPNPSAVIKPYLGL